MDTVTLVLNDAGDEFTITIPYGFFGLWDVDKDVTTVEAQDDAVYWRIVATTCATIFPDDSVVFEPVYTVALTIAIDPCFFSESWFSETSWTNALAASQEVFLNAGPDAGQSISLGRIGWTLESGASGA